MSALAILRSFLSNPVVNPIFSTIRGIARVIEKLAFFLAGRALLRRRISLQCVSTIFTLPTVHKDHLLFAAPLKNKWIILSSGRADCSIRGQ